MGGDLEVGGLAPLRPGLGKPVRGQRRPTNHITGHLDQRASGRPCRRSQPRQRPLRIQSFAVDKRLTTADLRYERADIIIGSVLTALFAV